MRVIKFKLKRVDYIKEVDLRRSDGPEVILVINMDISLRDVW